MTHRHDGITDRRYPIHATNVRATPLDASGNPAGPSMDLGPATMMPAPTPSALMATELDLTVVARRVLAVARFLEEHPDRARAANISAAMFNATLGVWRDLTGLDHQASLNLAQVIVDASDAGPVRAAVVPF